MNLPTYAICVPGLPERTDYVTSHLTARGVPHRIWQGFPGAAMGLATNKAYATDGHVDRFCEAPGSVNGKCGGQLAYHLGAGMIACTMSHLALYKHIIHAGYERTMIFENDVDLPEGFAERFAAFYANVPADADLIYLGWGFGDPADDERHVRPVAPGVAIIPIGSMQTHAYIVSRRAALFLDEHCQQAWRPIDVSIMVEAANHLRMYFAWPKIAGQLTASGRLDGSLHFDASKFAATEKPKGDVLVVADGTTWRYED